MPKENKPVNTQSQTILKHLKEIGSITVAESIRLYGYYRLSARILELRKMGMDIESISEEGFNRAGKKVRYVRYKLAEEKV